MLANVKKMFFILVVSSAATAADLKEGEWEVNYRMEVVGMPFPIPPITTKKTLCMTKDNLVPNLAQEGQDCKVSDQKANGNVVTWTMHCQTKEGKIDGQGKLTYKGERYDGVMDAQLISSANPEMPIRYRYTMDGQRLSACTK